MNRENRFKARDKIDGNWYDYSLFEIGCMGARNYARHELWRQYTGLKDKHGKEIYEGDIVRFCFCWSPEFRIDVVEYGTEDNPAGFENVTGQPSYECDNDIEVIGNIYENQELLND